MTVQNVYGAPHPPPEEHHKVVWYIHKIVQVVQTQSYKLEELAQYNSFLTRLTSTVMAQLAQMNVTMNTIQAQLNTLASAQTNQAKQKIKHYCCSCGK